MRITLTLTNLKSEAAKKAAEKFFENKKLTAADWQALKDDKVIKNIPKHIR